MKMLPDYRTVWRWHFYAGLFTIPFVLILSITGAIYLFKPQIEAWIDRPYENLSLSSSVRPVAEQVTATLAAFPDAKFGSFEVPPRESDAGRVMVNRKGESIRCYVNPATLEIMHEVATDKQLVNVVKRIHGELLLGQSGSYIVELAACWTIVMILTGLYLWLPRKLTGLAGVLYPRLRSGGKRFWRDIHSVAGFWISAFALILIMSGLPWAAFWGDYFKAIRSWTGTAVVRQDWSVGNEAKKQSPAGDHQSHQRGSGRWQKSSNSDFDVREIDQVIAAVRPLGLAHPVVISPPKKQNGEWSVKSMTGNRPQRISLEVDGKNGEIVSQETFGDRHLIDRIIGTGIALHEGQLFGWLNQAIGLTTVLGLMLLSFSGTVLWWRRRHTGLLSAPRVVPVTSRSPLLIGLILALAIYLPIFGASLAIVLLAERLILRRIPKMNHWLGLRGT